MLYPFSERQTGAPRGCRELRFAGDPRCPIAWPSENLAHILTITNSGSGIPTGQVHSVEGTPLDFTRPTPIGARIEVMGDQAGGYDHNYVLGDAGERKLAARVFDPHSGRLMEVWTTEPGVQFYTGNFLDGTLIGKRGIRYEKHAGFCLETQHYPDAVNQPNFPPIILRPGGTYRSETIYRFLAS